MDRRRLPTTSPGLALLPLRLFLGATFVYAGYQKLSDPGFLHPGSATYIGGQLHAFASGTPGGFVLRWFALPFPALAGVGVALTEIGIGLLVLAGLLTRYAAAAGLALNLLLFLTATWNTHPYFLGSDIVFCFAWLPFVLAGAADQPAVDSMLERGARMPAARPARSGRSSRVYTTGPTAETRRAVITRGIAAAGAGTLAVAGLATALRGTVRTGAALAAGRGAAAGAPHEHRRRHRHHDHPPTGTAAAGPPSGAVRIGPSSAIATGEAATYSDPNDGSPDIVVRRSDGGLAAFSAICTHAGCRVGYQGGVLYCPCHGSQFSAETGAVLQGPAASALPRKRVIERRGSVYAVD